MKFSTGRSLFDLVRIRTCDSTIGRRASCSLIQGGKVGRVKIAWVEYRVWSRCSTQNTYCLVITDTKEKTSDCQLLAVPSVRCQSTAQGSLIELMCVARQITDQIIWPVRSPDRTGTEDSDWGCFNIPTWLGSSVSSSRRQDITINSN